MIGHCYWGTQTKSNKIAWASVCVLALIGMGFWIPGMMTTRNCLVKFYKCDTTLHTKHANATAPAPTPQAISCVQGYKQCVFVPAVIWGIGWLFLGFSWLPCSYFCCCSRAPHAPTSPSIRSYSSAYSQGKPSIRGSSSGGGLGTPGGSPRITSYNPSPRVTGSGSTRGGATGGGGGGGSGRSSHSGQQRGSQSGQRGSSSGQQRTSSSSGRVEHHHASGSRQQQPSADGQGRERSGRPPRGSSGSGSSGSGSTGSGSTGSGSTGSGSGGSGSGGGSSSGAPRRSRHSGGSGSGLAVPGYAAPSAVSILQLADARSGQQHQQQPLQQQPSAGAHTVVTIAPATAAIDRHA